MIQELIKTLFASKDGIVVLRLIKELSKKAEEQVREAKLALISYSFRGNVDHMRDWALSSVAESLRHADTEFSAPLMKLIEYISTEKFQLLKTKGTGQGIDRLRRENELKKLLNLAWDDIQAHWPMPNSVREADSVARAAIVGIVAIYGEESYPVLWDVLANSEFSIYTRVTTLKLLSKHSGQLFDRNLPLNNSDWTESHIPKDEIQLWINLGMPKGAGYPALKQNPAIVQPNTALEKACSRLEAKLRGLREKTFDPARPSQILFTPGEELHNVQSLPTLYQEFYRRFNPLRVHLHNPKNSDVLILLSSPENDLENLSLHPDYARLDMPEHHFVIATIDDRVIFAIDSMDTDGEDAAVYAFILEPDWQYWTREKATDSLVEFIDSVATGALWGNSILNNA